MVEVRLYPKLNYYLLDQYSLLIISFFALNQGQTKFLHLLNLQRELKGHIRELSTVNGQEAYFHAGNAVLIASGAILCMPIRVN